MLYQAVTLRQIFNLTGSGPKRRSRNSRIMGIRSTQERDIKRFSFLVKSKEVYSWPQGHITSIHYPGLSLKKFRNDRRITPMNQTVQLHCTCPAFLYYGSKYWSTEYRYNFPDKTEHRPPNIRDPLGENWTCKHGIRAMNYVSKMGFEKLYKRFTQKKSSLKMASKEDIWRVASEYLHREHKADDSLLSEIFSYEEDDFINALAENGVFGPSSEILTETQNLPLKLRRLVTSELFG